MPHASPSESKWGIGHRHDLIKICNPPKFDWESLKGKGKGGGGSKEDKDEEQDKKRKKLQEG